MLPEKFCWLQWVLACDIVECSSGDVIGLALPDKRVVLEEVLKLRRVKVRLGFEDLLRLIPVAKKQRLTTIVIVTGGGFMAYSEMFSNSNSIPRL